jgi:hypothetical protein
VSKGRKIYRERLIGRYRAKGTKFTWKGTAKVRGRRTTDGYYFARVRRPGNRAVSRLVLERRRGRWHNRPDFQLRGTCGSLALAKFERPVFGGTRKLPLRFSYRLEKAARVTATVWKGKQRIRTFKAARKPAGKTVRLRVGLEGLRKGSYRVTLQVRRGKSRVVASLVSRRL